MLSFEDYKNALDIFKSVQFVSDDHSYLINNKRANSVTSILSQFVKPFDGDYWAEIKSKSLGISPDELKSTWEFNAKLAKVKGTVTHMMLESKLCATDFIYPEELILNHFGYDPIQDLLQMITPLVDKFILDIDSKMEAISSELVIGDCDYMVGGTVDQIFYNHKSKKAEIWDWKTNKQIKTMSKYYHLAPIDYIPDTELDHYSLQLCMYKLILQKNTALEFGDNYIVWFNEANTDYQIFRAKDYMKEAHLILSAY